MPTLLPWRAPATTANPIGDHVLGGRGQSAQPERPPEDATAEQPEHPTPGRLMDQGLRQVIEAVSVHVPPS
jgi:hypothetical protein